MVCNVHTQSYNTHTHFLTGQQGDGLSDAAIPVPHGTTPHNKDAGMCENLACLLKS